MAKHSARNRKRSNDRLKIRHRRKNGPRNVIQSRYAYQKAVQSKVKRLSGPSDSTQNAEKVEKSELVFEEVLALWLDNNRIRLKGGTITKYQNIIDKHIIPELGGVRISAISSSMINNLLSQKMVSGRLDCKGGLSPSYVRSIMLVINAAITFAVKEEMCPPLKTPISRPVNVKKDLSVLTPEEQKRFESYLMENLNPTKTGILISLYTGLRVGEICALLWENVDLENRILRVRHTIARVQKKDCTARSNTALIVDSPKTRTSTRDIPISSVLQPILAAAKKRAVSRYVISEVEQFVSPRTFEYRYHRLLQEAGIRSINYHALRHTFATRCVEAGVDVKTLSEILGHANVGITLNTYVHSAMALKRSQLEKMASCFI